ncbi:glutamine amidotransferase [Mollicutes bacterium LVI A0039]|nr:glutamine amidotransferase [Mollicutes bacterium LVI A0039]
MQINICHLYPDLLNVYGDVGNILILKDRLLKRGIEVNVLNVSTNEPFNAEEYDIVLLGGGQDNEQTIVSDDLFKKRVELQKYIEDEKVLLAICGGYQLLGEYYIGANGERIEGLDLIDIVTESGNDRFIGNTISKEAITGDYIVGFENHSGRTILGDNVQPMAEVVVGFGNNGQDKTCGCIYKNTFGTYFHGSFLAKNNKMADELIKRALEKKYNKEIILEPIDDEFYEKARETLFDRYMKK